MKKPDRPGGPDPNDSGPDYTNQPPGPGEWPPDAAFISAHDDVTDSVTGQLTDILNDYFPHADIRTSDDKRRIGMWIERQTTAAEARDNGLANLKLRPKHDFVLTMSPSVIYAMGDVVWKRLPKRYNQWGNEPANPDDTAVILERFDLELQAPAMIRLHVHGVAPGAIFGLASPGFDYTQIDMLMIDQDMHVRAVKVDAISPDPGILQFFMDLFGVSAGTPNAPNPGAMLAGRLPKQMLIPGGPTKVVVLYDEVHISPETGLRIEVSKAIRFREPKITVSADRVNVAYEATAARAHAMWDTRDFRNPKVEWHTDGSVDAHGNEASITYPLPQPHPLHLTHTVRVTATDADGGSASAHTDVHIDSPRPD